MAAVGRGDELRGDADAIAGLAYAAFKDMRHAKRLSDPPDVGLPALERERRRACDHFQPGDPRQGVDDVLGKAVAEVLVLFVPAHILERQHGDRRLLVSWLD